MTVFIFKLEVYLHLFARPACCAAQNRHGVTTTPGTPPLHSSLVLEIAGLFSAETQA
jgi:hypothetical protein